METLHEFATFLEGRELLRKDVPLEERYCEALRLQETIQLFDIDDPVIHDFSEILKVSGIGRVRVIRMDLNSYIPNHKKLVVAGLIIRGVLTGSLLQTSVDILIDGGNFNSASALKFYTRRFGMKGMYVMSDLFPREVTDLLEDQDHFSVIRAPRSGEGLEREFYAHLFKLMRQAEFRRNKHCLWHARYGGWSQRPFGRMLSEKLDTAPDILISSLGAGSTLEGLLIPIQDHFDQKASSILIAEHEQSPLFANMHDVLDVSRLELPSATKSPVVVPGLPHTVIGPHYSEINPLLKDDARSRIEGVVQFNQKKWLAVQEYLAQHEISVGNSSAANISTAWRLAKQGHDVLTIIYEPNREFYFK